MITELRLENWKSFGEATLYIDPLSILIGTNASGKSNVLDALQFLQWLTLGKTLTDALIATRGGLEWATRKSHDNFALGLMIRINDIDHAEYRIECVIRNGHCLLEKEEIKQYKLNNNGLVLFSGTTLNGNIGNSYLSDKHSYLFDITSFFGKNASLLEDNSILTEDGHVLAKDKNVAWDLMKVVVLTPNPSNMKNYSSLSDRLISDSSNIAGVLAALPANQQKEIENILTQYAKRLPESEIHRIYAEKVGKLGKDAMLYCDEKWGESGEVFTVDARAMSDGTLRFLAILTALLTLPEGSLLAIDEVDNGLHPSRANLLLEALYEIGKQRKIDVLITTHNSALLDALGTTFIPFITVAHRDIQTGESKLTLLEDIDQLPKLLAQGTVGKLAARGLLEKSLESQHE